MEILECSETNQQIVMPLFYKVNLSNVRHQRKSFSEVLVKHESRFTEETVQRWKVALYKVAYLSDWHLEQGYVFWTIICPFILDFFFLSSS
jgi:hypothetical protein